MLEVSIPPSDQGRTHERNYCCSGWSELVLALPEFVLNHVRVDAHDELVAVVELPREVQACPGYGAIELHLLRDWRWHSVRHLPVGLRCLRRRAGRGHARGSRRTPPHRS